MVNTAKKNNAIKIAFKLKVEGSWPPFQVENLWLIKIDEYFEVRNIPFFIDNLAFKDLIAISKLDGDLYEIKQIIKRSRNSTLLLFFCDEKIRLDVLNKVKMLGCRYETGVLFGYYAINIPPKVTIDEFELALKDHLEAERILLDYPFVFNQ